MILKWLTAFSGEAMKMLVMKYILLRKYELIFAGNHLRLFAQNGDDSAQFGVHMI